MRRWQHAARACLGDFTPQGLGTSVLALAHLGATVELDFLSEWKGVAIAKLATFTAISLAMAMQGLAKLPCAFFLEDVFAARWKECVRSRFAEFLPLETVLCVCALAKRGLKQEVAADPLFIEWLHVTSLEQFKPRDLAMALWALATLEARPKDYEHFVGNWFARARQLVPVFNPVDLVNTIWTCSKLGLREEDFLRRWTRAALSWINCFSGAELAVTMKSLELLEVDPYSDLVAEWLRCAARLMPLLDARDLSSIVPALGAMRCRDVQFLNAMQQRLTQLAPTLDSRDAATIFYGLALLHCCNEQCWKVDGALIAQCIAAVAVDLSIGIEAADRCLHSCCWFGLTVPLTIVTTVAKECVQLEIRASPFPVCVQHLARRKAGTLGRAAAYSGGRVRALTWSCAAGRWAATLSQDDGRVADAGPDAGGTAAASRYTRGAAALVAHQIAGPARAGNARVAALFREDARPEHAAATRKKRRRQRARIMS
jgi:hypothetical protein